MAGSRSFLSDLLTMCPTLAALCVAALSLGCGANSSLIPVTGQVLLDDMPLGSGSLTLEPDPVSQSWDRPVGTIGPEGQFTIFTNGRLGAPPGNYRIVIFAHAETDPGAGSAHPGLPASLIAERYQRGETTPLRLSVKNEPIVETIRLTSDANP
jgi:hypothetical protein